MPQMWSWTVGVVEAMKYKQTEVVSYMNSEDIKDSLSKGHLIYPLCPVCKSELEFIASERSLVCRRCQWGMLEDLLRVKDKELPGKSISLEIRQNVWFYEPESEDDTSATEKTYLMKNDSGIRQK